MNLDMISLLQELNEADEIVKKYVFPESAINHMYWELFLKYVGSTSSISYTIIDEFIRHCPTFYNKLSEYAVPRKRIITLEYGEKKAPYQSLVYNCENAIFSGILYMHMCDSFSMASYKPFGKLIPAKEPEYFIGFISNLNSQNLTDDEKYEFFKNYFYSHVVREIKTEFTHHYAFENGIWQNIKFAYPELAKRFAKEQEGYLHEIGYYRAKEALSLLNTEYNEKVASMSQEEKDQLAEIWPDGETSHDFPLPRNERRIKIIY